LGALTARPRAEQHTRINGGTNATRRSWECRRGRSDRCHGPKCLTLHLQYVRLS